MVETEVHGIKVNSTTIKQWGDLEGGKRDYKSITDSGSDGTSSWSRETYIVDGWRYVRNRYADGIWEEWQIDSPNPDTYPFGPDHELNAYQGFLFCSRDDLTDLKFQGTSEVNGVPSTHFSASLEGDGAMFEEPGEYWLFELWVDEDSRFRQHKTESHITGEGLNWERTVTYSDFGQFHKINAPVPRPSDIP